MDGFRGFKAKYLLMITLIGVGFFLLSACYSTPQSNLNVSAPDNISANVGGSSNALISFSSETSLSQLSVDLSTLPAGWAGPAQFSCDSLSNDSGCLLGLSFTPTSSDQSGTLSLPYTYVENNIAKTGHISFSYNATSTNNVNASLNLPTPIKVAANSSKQVIITFRPDDGIPASHLQILNGLTNLPSGWTGPATFTCGAVKKDNSCTLALTYNPTSATQTGTLSLDYTYNSSYDGPIKSNTISIPYRSSAENSITGTASTNAPIVSRLGVDNTVNVQFTTDTGSASNFNIIKGLDNLASGWTGPANFNCHDVSTSNNHCVLNLHFQPSTKAQTGVLILSYTYLDNTGATRTGSAKIDYSANQVFAYVANNGANDIGIYALNGDGSFKTDAVPVPYPVTNPELITLDSFANAYIVANHAITRCEINNSTGALGQCTSLTPTDTNGNAISNITNLTFTNDFEAYLIGSGSGMTNQFYSCATNPPSGTIANCTPMGGSINFSPIAATLTSYWETNFQDYAYISNSLLANTITECPVNNDGSLGTCSNTIISNTLVSPVTGMTTLATNTGYVFYWVGGGTTLNYCQVPVDTLHCGQVPAGTNPDSILSSYGSIYVVNQGTTSNDGSITVYNYDANGIPSNGTTAVTGLDHPEAMVLF